MVPRGMTVKGRPSSSTASIASKQTVTESHSFAVRSTSSTSFQALRRGPSDPAGTLVRLSDRPSMCISALGAEIAVGSSDHAVYILNVEKGKFVRALYGKQWGHTEWVTCVKFMDDGRVLSGGMDSKLCLWEKNVVRCSNLIGHSKSVSACATNADSSLGISSSYDKTLKVWDLRRGSRTASCLGTLRGHAGAVVSFIFSAKQDWIVSGSRVGELIMWDVEEGRILVHCRNAHAGQITALESIVGGADPDGGEGGTGDLVLTGGQDGFLKCWDFRANPACVDKSRIFDSSPVGFLATSYEADGSALVVAVGDKMVKVLDPRASFQAIHTMSEHKQGITCLYVNGGLAWSGALNGMLIAHQVATGECLYGLGADKGAVKCVCLAGDNKLAVAGEDGNVLIYSH